VYRLDREALRESVKPDYQKNDLAHQIDHADQVWENAKELVRRNEIVLDMDLLYACVYVHDVCVWKDRAQHHVRAAEYVLRQENELLNIFSVNEQILISHAVREHRSSTKMKPSTKYSYVLQMADKGKPVLRDVIARSAKYHNKNGKSVDAIAREVGSHLSIKFGRNGYAFTSEYKKAYSNDVEAFWYELDELTVEELLTIIRESIQ